MEKCFQDVREDEKHVPDLLEPIIQPPGLVKEELRPNLFKLSQFRPENRARARGLQRRMENAFFSNGFLSR